MQLKRKVDHKLRYVEEKYLIHYIILHTLFCIHNFKTVISGQWSYNVPALAKALSQECDISRTP